MKTFHVSTSDLTILVNTSTICLTLCQKNHLNETVLLSIHKQIQENIHSFVLNILVNLNCDPFQNQAACAQ